MPRIALVLAGAVSLGSYEGGALEELLYLLDLLNADRGSDPYVLDVIAGASAGAMTGALVARATLNNQRHRKALHDAWVDDIDIVDLIRRSPPNSILSKEPIAAIADRYLGLGEDGEDAPASYAPAILRMAFTLSNLNGVDYALPIRHAQGVRFTSTFYSDQRRFRLTRADALDAAKWKDIRQAAIASGNFPFAFSPAPVRTPDDAYPGHSLRRLLDPFFFVDGGMFNNEPIREAVALAREADGDAIDPDRTFILVDANLNHSTHDPEITDTIELVATTKRLLGMLLGESSANDWLRAERLNTQLDWRDAMIRELREMVERNELAEPERFLDHLHAISERITRRKRELFGDDRYPARYLTESLERTRRQNRELMDGLSEGRRRILTSLIFVLNSVSGLDKKSPLNLEILYANHDELAGDRLASFGGFFSREWREHDYRLGRRAAHALLPSMLGVGDYEPEPGVAYEPERDLGGATMRDIPNESRRRAREVVVAKANGLLKQQLGAGLTRWAARKAIMKKVEDKVDAFLEL